VTTVDLTSNTRTIFYSYIELFSVLDLDLIWLLQLVKGDRTRIIFHNKGYESRLLNQALNLAPNETIKPTSPLH
jgi:hypothetical protein